MHSFAISRHFRFISAALCLTGLSLPSRTHAETESITTTYVILKLDDVTAPTPQWKRTFDFLKSKNIKSSAGIICNSLEPSTRKPGYLEWLKEVQQSGLVEFWLHGYDHGLKKENGKDVWEFKGPPYEIQKDHIVKSQALAKSTLGAPFTSFGAPFNQTDSSTLRALREDPDLKVVLYGEPKYASAIPEMLILDRTQANIETPIFIPNPKKLQQDFEALKGTRDCIVIQGHPNMWNDAKFSDFEKLIQYLQDQGVIFATPTEFLKTRQPGLLRVSTASKPKTSASTASSAAIGDNLLKNGDFEDGTRGWALFDPSKSASAACTFDITSENPHDGADAAMLSSASNARYAAIQYLPSAELEAGQRYRVSAWVRADDDFVRVASTPGFAIRVTMFGPNFSGAGVYYLGFGGLFGTEGSALLGPEVPKSWTKIEGVLEIPEGVEKANVCLFVDMGTGRISIDDVKFERVDQSTPLEASESTQ